ncbi:MAG: hypothetical protein HKP07_08885 [Flavobacteriaceae bacterium]|nr:hypothetical protein [Flavobacteriaceae bacterium]NNK34877.1 hypothetical protein [Eudoraea sp.]
MNTLDPQNKSKSKQPTTQPIHFLERQQTYLVNLSRQLNSYHCVPKTVQLHEQMDRLKRCLDSLISENEDLIIAIRKSGKSELHYFDECEAQFSKMMQLERDVLAYVGKAKIQG